MSNSAKSFFTEPAQNRGFDEVIKFINALSVTRGEKTLNKIQIAGTNGKGSTSAMLASILSCAGYKTGLYTSPSLVTVNERIRINGAMIDDQTLVSYIPQIDSAQSTCDRLFGGFERITAAAYLYYLDENVDFAVMETGLGGRLDTVSAVDKLILASITSIGLDHTKMLGDTIDMIAMEKCGIIRKCTPVVMHPQCTQAKLVIENTSNAIGAELIYVDECNISPKCATATRQSMVIAYDSVDYNIDIGLLGDYQRQNAANALLCALKLNRMGLANITKDDIERGFRQTAWDGRLQTVHISGLNSPIIVDGAHNPQAMHALVNTLLTLYPNTKFNVVVSIMHDKDVTSILEEMRPVVKTAVCVRVNARATDENELAQAAKNVGISAVAAETVDAGLFQCNEMSGGETILVLGSLYLVGNVLGHVESHV